jgi:hypothetical protein
MTFQKIAERSAIPLARGQEKRVFGWGAVALVCHVTSLAQRRAKAFGDFERGLAAQKSVAFNSSGKSKPSKKAVSDSVSPARNNPGPWYSHPP